MKWLSFDYAQAKEQWHYWFAWYSVTTYTHPDGTEKKVWLEKVKRRGYYCCDYFDCYWCWEYKE